MLQTYEAVLEPDGHIQFTEAAPVPIAAACRVLVTFTETPADIESALCGARLSEPALAKDWLSAEEDAAWAHLQTAR